MLLALAALLAFAIVAEQVAAHLPAGIDYSIRSWVLAHRWGPAATLALALDVAGAAPVLVVLAALAALWLWRTGRAAAALATLFSSVGSSAGFVIVKAFMHRVRPAGALPLHITTYSFPSGHATVAAAVLPALAYLLARERVLAFPTAIMLGAALPLLLGASRVYLDVHWTTDVLAGWCLGLAVAAVSAAWYEHARTRLPSGRTADP